MALSSAELLQLQQSLTQLAKASSNIASFATQLGSIQSNSTTTIQTETKYRRTVIDDYASLSKTLQNQSKQFKDVLKNVNDFSDSVTQLKDKQSIVSGNLATLQAAIAAAGSATSAQTVRQTKLTNMFDRLAEKINIASLSEKNEKVSDAVISLIESSKDAARYRSEYEKDFYGRQLANEVRTALDNIASVTGAKFGSQLLDFADMGKLAEFADLQQQVVRSLLDNNQTISDSNSELARNYIDLGRSLGYTATEFDNFATQLDGWAAGSTITLSNDVLNGIVDAQEVVANVINESNERLSGTIERDIRSFSGQVRQYMFDNRNGFDRLFDELADIRTRHGSLTTGEGGSETAEALRTATGMIGKEIIPRMSEILKMMGNYYTKEYDALTNYVQTSRLVALQLNMTEDQYRRARTESKAIWNLAADSGQKQLDEFLTSRRLQLEAVYGSEPELRDKMGVGFYNLNKVLGVSGTEVNGMIKDFEKLSLTSRMSSTELTELFFNLANSNDNMLLMNGLSEKGRQARIQELRYTTSLVSNLGLAGEAAANFAKALTESPTKAPSAGEVVGEFGNTQVLYSQMNNMAQTMGVQLGITADQMKELGYIRGIQKMGVDLTKDQIAKEAIYSKAISDFATNFRSAQNKRAQEMGGADSGQEFYSLLQSTQLRNLFQEFTKSSNLDSLVDPMQESKIAMEKYSVTQNMLINSTDELRKAFDRQVDLANRRAEDIKVPKVITGIAAEGQRLYEASSGNLWTETLAKLGGGALAVSALQRLAPSLLTGAIEMLGGGALASIAVPVLAALGVGGALYGAYSYLHSDNTATEESKTETATETPKQPEKPVQVTPASEAERSTSPLPSSQVSAAETANATTILNEQFTKYFSSVDTQNQIMAGFLKQLADTSAGMGKDVKEWYKFYQDIHPITSLLPDDKTKSGDTSKAH